MSLDDEVASYVTSLSKEKSVNSIFKRARKLDYIDSTVKEALSIALLEFFTNSFDDKSDIERYLKWNGYKPFIDMTVNVRKNLKAHGAKNIDFDEVYLVTKSDNIIPFITVTYKYIMHMYYKDGELVHVYAAIYDYI